MARYINADALIDNLNDLTIQVKQSAETWEVDLQVLVRAIQNCETADVRPNVRGEWVEDELGTTVCSNCKNPRRDNRIKHIAFCNSCGADMRGEEHE